MWNVRIGIGYIHNLFDTNILYMLLIPMQQIIGYHVCEAGNKGPGV